MAKVLVTGATGFIALHCIDQLLKAGHSVRGTLRTMSRSSEVCEAAGEFSDRLEFAYADLTGDDGWIEAAHGCDFVMHTASPVPRGEPEHEDDLIIPARDGTIRVLTAAKAACVKRVVLTSSIAAVTRDSKKPKSHVYSESDWTVVEEAEPYSKSKTIAERDAWDFASDQAMELATILPGPVLGPVLSKDCSASGDLVSQIMQRGVPMVPPIEMTTVDVRDVAAAHVEAMTNPQAAGERFICVGEPVWMKDIAKTLESEYAPKGWSIPTRGLPLWAAKLGANFHPRLKQAKPFLGKSSKFDTSKLRDVLGVEPRGSKEMVLAMAESMVRLGLVESG